MASYMRGARSGRMRRSFGIGMKPLSSLYGRWHSPEVIGNAFGSPVPAGPGSA